MAKNFRHMCRQQSCEKLPPVPQRGLFFFFFSQVLFALSQGQQMKKKKISPKSNMNAPLSWTPRLLNLSHFPISHLPRCLIRILPPTPTAICLWFKYQVMQTSNQTLIWQIGSFCTLAVNTEHLKPLRITVSFQSLCSGSCRRYTVAYTARTYCIEAVIFDDLCEIFPFALLTFSVLLWFPTDQCRSAGARDRHGNRL